MLVDTLFWLLALTAVLSGFAVFRVSSMARATFALAVSFVAVGAVMLLLDLDYLGLITVLMMVMEMSIMAVFMIMYMMNPGGLMPMSMYHNKAGAMTVAVGSFVVLAAGALLVPWPERQGVAPADITLQLGEGIMG
ncbi:MAG: NADH-quinone oxidoreductase subunit J, partial [Actinomycetota bacterium]|nr:NADH-quinone oxidoreductase subunit J [Actinomycetota bacterium]